MNAGTTDNTTRRRFFAGTLRAAALGLIGAAGLLASAKRHRLISQGICLNRGLCAGCEVLEHCWLPPAMSAKAVVNGAGDDRPQ